MAMPDLSRRNTVVALAIAAAFPLLARATASTPAAPLRIGVFGAGWLGGTVGRAPVAAGHEVRISSRHPEQLRSMVTQLGPRASVDTPLEVATFGSVILLAVLYAAIPDLGRDLAAAWRGKIRQLKGVIKSPRNPQLGAIERVHRDLLVSGTSLPYVVRSRIAPKKQAVRIARGSLQAWAPGV